MAWEWIDDLADLTGSPGSSTGPNTTWEKALEALEENPAFYQLTDSGDYGTDGEYNKFYDGYNNHQINTIETSWGLTITYNSESVGGVSLNWTEGGQSHGQGWGSIFGKYGIRFAIERTLEQAVCVALWRFTNPGWYTIIQNCANYTTEANRQSLYRLLQGATPPPPVTYTWESVPKLIGNGKTYRLTKILNINNGEPVNNVPRKTNLDFSAKSKVNNMVNELMPVAEDARKAIVRYEVPNANYEYCKIVYKKEHIPTSVTDGIAKTVDYDDAEVTITGLSEDTLYYFVVFTDKTESDPYRFKTGKQGGIFKMYIQTSKSLVENSFIENISYSEVTT